MMEVTKPVIESFTSGFSSIGYFNEAKESAPKFMEVQIRG